MDPLAGTPWSAPNTVAGFVRGEPNQTLLAYAAQARSGGGRVLLDIGCGAARNLLPIALQGWAAIGTDLSSAMLGAARTRIDSHAGAPPVLCVQAPMERLPIRSQAVDLVVAHGIWNLATSDAQFRAAVDEASRVITPGGALFLFTFSRRTLPDHATPIEGQSLTFTQFSGHPQVFLDVDTLYAELARAGFEPDPALPLVEHNAPTSRTLQVAGGGPVIYEGGFRRLTSA
jgi:ubiquinone/menaquinone biosynthesis C-methylase UbiE